MIVYDVRESKSGTWYVVKIVMIRSLQMFAAIFFHASFLLNTKNLIEESLDCSRKNFDVRKCACSARLTAVMTL